MANIVPATPATFVPVQRPETTDVALGGNQTNFPGRQLGELATRDQFLWDCLTVLGLNTGTQTISGIKALLAGDALAASSESNALQSMIASTARGRLTLQTNTPVTLNDVTSASVFYTQFNGDVVSLWNSTLSRWDIFNFTEVSLSLGGLAANTNHDIFLFNNGGTLTLQAVAWASASTRSAALTRRNGVWVKQSDNRRYLGTIRTTLSGQTVDTQSQRYVWNAQNRTTKVMVRQMIGLGLYTYNGSAWRPCNNDTAYRLEVVAGESQAIKADVGLLAQAQTNFPEVAATVSIGLNSTTVNSAQIYGNRPRTDDGTLIQAILNTALSPGYHYLQMLEASGSSGQVSTFAGENIVDGQQRGVSGITALWDC